jgi:SAM-dependent methyltransferase
MMYAKSRVSPARSAQGAAWLRRQTAGKTQGAQKENDYDYIRQSFSREWTLFDYENDKTWGWTLEERKRIFLDDMGLNGDGVKGKLLLDAGCGNGTLTAALSTLGMNVVGVDLSDGLGVINSNKARFAGKHSQHLHFVQGNIFSPPFKNDTFNLIYCSGVIHHTPNSRETFKRLVPLLKRGGRMYVWVYGRRNFVVRAFMDSGRQLKRFMSLESLMNFCRLTAPVYKVGTGLLDSLGIVRFRERTTREITLDLFDAFAPKYNHRHTEEEVMGWFKEVGFTNVTVSGRQKHGFGVFGDKR